MGGSLGLHEIIISYNVQEYEMRTLPKSGDFSEMAFCQIILSVSGMVHLGEG